MKCSFSAKTFAVPYLLCNLVAVSVGLAQATPAAPAPVAHIESLAELKARLSASQNEVLDGAMKDFGAQHYAEALVPLEKLLAAVPGDAVLSKFIAEAALNTGDTGVALVMLKPIAANDPNDWQAAELWTRACAESGDITCRDAGMAHMQELQRAGITPPQVEQYIAERIKLGESVLVIRRSLVPWGGHHVYELGQVFGQDGKRTFRITLESDDFDQPLFARDHPKEAAQGMRQFSMDGYSETEVTANGQGTWKHFTYKFFTGEPSYAEVRQAFVDIASGKANALSASVKATAPAQ